MRTELQKKVDRAIRLLKSIPTDKGDIEISYSGGKDSDVILELAKMAGIPYRAIYKATTIDPPKTIAHAREMGAEVVRPKKTFFQLVSEKGFPSRFARFCCSALKEYKICDRAIQGIRRVESRKRAENYKEPEVCRVYSAKEKVKVYLPILEWTDEDVAEFIKERNIKSYKNRIDRICAGNCTGRDYTGQYVSKIIFNDGTEEVHYVGEYDLKLHECVI